jgi:hypothetical protein
MGKRRLDVGHRVMNHEWQGLRPLLVQVPAGSPVVVPVDYCQQIGIGLPPSKLVLALASGTGPVLFGAAYGGWGASTMAGTSAGVILGDPSSMGIPHLGMDVLRWDPRDPYGVFNGDHYRFWMNDDGTLWTPGPNRAVDGSRDYPLWHAGEAAIERFLERDPNANAELRRWLWGSLPKTLRAVLERKDLC